LIAATFSGGHGFSLAAVPGTAIPNSPLQCAIQALHTPAERVSRFSMRNRANSDGGRI